MDVSLGKVGNFIVIAAAVALVGYPAFKSISADGTVQYCYVDTERHTVPNQADVVVYRMMGFRAWRTDRQLAPALKNLEEVKVAAKEYGCELK